jgi:hypothetical protein
MATTTNYSWTTPDDTALVKDGASAIRTLGSSVDTTTKNLNPSTTLGDIEYRSSTSNTNTRVGIGSSGQALTVVAGVPSWAASATSTLTTTGDTLYASAANTLARRAIGSTGDVLTVSGGLPTWATPSSGGMTLLSTTTLSGATVTISSINQNYKSLVMFIYAVTNATGAGNFQCVVNTANVGSFTRASTNSAFAFAAGANITLSSITANYKPKHTSSLNGWCFRIDNYANATGYKPIQISGAYRAEDAYADDMWVNNSGGVVTTSAVTQLIFSNTGGNLSTGTIELYGVK